MSEQGRTIYECRFVREEIPIGGEVASKLWKNAAPAKFYVPLTHADPISNTEAGVLWSENCLYTFFRAYDKDIFAYHTERDSTTCQDDVLELFFKTRLNKEPYYNFEINALATVYDAYNLKSDEKAGGSRRWSKWNCEGLKVAARIQGTLNDPTDVDEYWELEIAVPFASLDLGGKSRPEPADEWLCHLARYDYSVYLPEGCELSSTARLNKVNFHLCEEWNCLRFVT